MTHVFFLIFVIGSESRHTSNERKTYLSISCIVIPLCFKCVEAIGIITVRTGLFSLVKWLSKMLFSKYKEKFTIQQNSIQEPQNDCFTNEHESLIHILYRRTIVCCYC